MRWGLRRVYQRGKEGERIGKGLVKGLRKVCFDMKWAGDSTVTTPWPVWHLLKLLDNDLTNT